MYVLTKTFNFRRANILIIIWLIAQIIWYALPCIGFYYHNIYNQIISFILPFIIIKMFINILLAITILQLKDLRVGTLRFYCFTTFIVAPLTSFLIYTTRWVYYLSIAHELIIVVFFLQLYFIFSRTNNKKEIVTA